jgi:hypothetical protein
MASTSLAARLLLCAMTVSGAACSRPEGVKPPAGRAAAEIARIQQHLARAEAAVRAADVSHLTDEQRAARRTHLARLGRYREAGRFPHNHVDGTVRPIFVDGHGTRCAMTHLIEASGGGELVARVARERNGAYVRELAGDPELVGWLDRNGISLAEAAAVQPQYEGDPAFQPWLALASLAATATDVAAIVVNRSSDAGTGAGWFGVVAGVGSVVVGVAPLHRSQQSTMVILSAVNIGMGVTAGLFGLRNLVNERPEPSPPGRRVSLAPAVGPLNGVVLQGQF